MYIYDWQVEPSGGGHRYITTTTMTTTWIDEVFPWCTGIIMSCEHTQPVRRPVAFGGARVSRSRATVYTRNEPTSARALDDDDYIIIIMYIVIIVCSVCWFAVRCHCICRGCYAREPLLRSNIVHVYLVVVVVVIGHPSSSNAVAGIPGRTTIGSNGHLSYRTRLRKTSLAAAATAWIIIIYIYHHQVVGRSYIYMYIYRNSAVPKLCTPVPQERHQPVRGALRPT